MCRALLGWLLPLLTISLAISGTRSFAEDDPKGSSGSTGISEVIAEGVGATPDEALKNAFRNAVRQVVGAVVDAEMLIKNDEVIDDQVLTYSDGFVKKYDEVAGSKKSVGGLHRVKIKAQVERRSVIAKLKSAKVTVKDFDGKNLFAEAVTSAEAEENSTKLLAKALADLPKLLTASVAGKPEYDREKGEVVLNVEVEVDAKGYRDFSAKLQETLRKMSISKVTDLVKAEPINERQVLNRLSAKVPNLLIAPNPKSLLGPTIAKDKTTHWCFWVCASSTGNDRSQRWNGYVIDADIRTTAMPFMNRTREESSNERRPIVHVGLSDESGNIVGEDEFTLVRGHDMGTENKFHYRLPWLLLVTPRHRSMPQLGYGESADVMSFFVPSRNTATLIESYVLNAYVAPFAMEFSGFPGNLVDLNFVRKQTYQRRIKLTLDELKLVKNVKCSVVYTPGAAATK